MSTDPTPTPLDLDAIEAKKFEAYWDEHNWDVDIEGDLINGKPYEVKDIKAVAKYTWMEQSRRLRTESPAPAAEEPPFAWPDPKYTAYSFEGPRGITCAVSEDGDIFIRPNATREELHAALLGVLSDEGIPLPERAPAPTSEVREAVAYRETLLKVQAALAGDWMDDWLGLGHLKLLRADVAAALSPQVSTPLTQPKGDVK
jgi:hypothetical protein